MRHVHNQIYTIWLPTDFSHIILYSTECIIECTLLVWHAIPAGNFIDLITPWGHS